MKTIVISIVLLSLTACGAGNQENIALKVDLTPSAEDIKFAEAALPSNERLTEIYERSCASCHALSDAEAPLTGHKVAWDHLLSEKGLNGLVTSAKMGINAMPAMGYCLDCSDEDFAALIEFMANREGS